MSIILVIENDRDLLDLYKRKLRDEGYDVIGHPTIQDALSQTTDRPPIHLTLLEMQASLQEGV